MESISEIHTADASSENPDVDAVTTDEAQPAAAEAAAFIQ